MQELPGWPLEEDIKPESLAVYLGEFDKGRKLDWLAHHPKAEAALAEFLELLPQRMIDRFESALGFIGLFVKYGPRILQGKAAKPLMQLMELFLRMRAQQVSSEAGPVKPKLLLEHLERLALRLLLQGERSWQEARSRDEWLELLRSRPDMADLA